MTGKFRFVLLAIVASLAAVGAFAFQEDAAAPKEKKAVEPREAIRRALEKKIDWNFNETPLSEVIDALAKELKIPIKMDTRAMNDLGVSCDNQVTFKLSGVTAKTALKLLLHKLGLTTYIADEVLLVTSTDEAELHLRTVVYDVSDLVSAEDQGKSSDFAPLQRVIRLNVKPSSWNGLGEVTPFAAAGVKAIVVLQTDDGHEDLADLLASLRAARRGPKADGKEKVSRPTAPLSSKGAAEEKIREALSKPIKLEFVETPLKDAIDILRNRSGISIYLDWRALNDLGLSEDTQVTCQVENVSLETALNLLLRDLGLYWRMDEALLVTSPEEIEDNMVTRVYDVSDLPSYRTQAGATLPNYEALIAMAWFARVQLGWDVPTGSRTEFNADGLQVLVITDTLQNHRRIGAVFDDLRNLRKTPVTNDDLENLPPPPPQVRPQQKGTGGGM